MNLEIQKIINIYTDGACIKNGKKNSIGGIGVYFPNSDYPNISKKITFNITNNRAELLAIIEALRIVKNEDNVIIFTDSEYSFKGILKFNGRFKNKDLFDIIDNLIKDRKGKTSFRYVKGHTGLKDGNYFADNLATKAIKS